MDLRVTISADLQCVEEIFFSLLFPVFIIIDVVIIIEPHPPF